MENDVIREWKTGRHIDAYGPNGFIAFKKDFFEGTLSRPATTEPIKSEPAGALAEAEAAGLIQDYKSLPEHVRKTLSFADFTDLKTLAASGDREAGVALDHYTSAGKSFWRAWSGDVKSYYHYLQGKEKKSHAKN